MCDDDDDNNNTYYYYWGDIRNASWPGCVAHTEDEKSIVSKDFFSTD
jgi:hypothetical protein